MLKCTADIGSGLGFLAIAAAFFFQHDDSTGVSHAFPLLLMGIIAWGGVYYLIKGLLEYARSVPTASVRKGSTGATSSGFPSWPLPMP